MTTLAVETHNGKLWLVSHDAPGCDTSTLLAQFVSPQAAEAWIKANDAAMRFSREVGRSGLGD